MGECEHAPLIDQHFARRISVEKERQLRAHLPGCATCTARYDRMLARDRLNGDSAQERLGAALGFAAARPTPRVWWYLPALAAACIALLWLRPKQASYEPRGGSPAAAALEIYVAGPGAKLRPVSKTIGANDELAFAYRNAAGKQHLLVFARGVDGELRWYYPAWTEPTTNPSAIAIAPGDAVHELGEAVRHPLAPGPISIRAIFTDRAPNVRDVEAAVAAGELERLVPDAVIVERRLEVTR